MRSATGSLSVDSLRWSFGWCNGSSWLTCPCTVALAGTLLSLTCRAITAPGLASTLGVLAGVLAVAGDAVGVSVAVVGVGVRWSG
ncbi:MAG: hypothetical protein H0T73_14935, partial [Ardenticatenales bacterium]|nr:hypothetical protein [Ardenticatenales bacterium]